MDTGNPLKELARFGQSPWCDQLSRSMIENGELERMIDEDGLMGVTTNPTIFEKSISAEADYQDDLRGLAIEGRSAEEICDALTIEDVRRTADIFRRVFEATGGADGYVSLEVNPLLASKTAETVEEARRLHAAVGRPNVMIKIPATTEGLPAVEELIALGINVNVTLIFSIAVYEAVAEAYLRGIERRVAKTLPVNEIASVASFFVSRIDTAVDERLHALITESSDAAKRCSAEGLLGQTAIANARLAYQSYKRIFGSERFRRTGARPQRCLWASTSTKNPNYPDVLYVEGLIGRETVNTMPLATLKAWRDHGRCRASLEDDPDKARRHFEMLRGLGIDFEDVTAQLRYEGVAAFSRSFENLAELLRHRRVHYRRGMDRRFRIHTGGIEDGYRRTLALLERDRAIERIFRKDTALWKSQPAHRKNIAESLGWLDLFDSLRLQTGLLEEFAGEIRRAGFEDVVLLGMGGSSLCPELFRRVVGSRSGYPKFRVLDSTVPAAVAAVDAATSAEKTLFIFASKSGSTIEPLSFYRHCFARVAEKKRDRAGENFVAITDPKTFLEQEARSKKFRQIFLNPADIGGRFSALSLFGLVPAALMGIDAEKLLERGADAMALCRESRAAFNPGLALGALLGAAAAKGCDKLTLLLEPRLEALGFWIEQLVAESTGKDGRGILPVVETEIRAPEEYGSDRVFAAIRFEPREGPADGIDEWRIALKALRDSGRPVVEHTLDDHHALAEIFYVWEFATAVAGVLLGINPFDQPNVQEAKDQAVALIRRYEEKKAFDPETPRCSEGPVSAYGKFEGATVSEMLAKFFASLGKADYVAITAFIEETPLTDAFLKQLKHEIANARRVAVTTGYGPRFLHSTGQLHKGGPPSCAILQITAGDRDEIPIAGTSYSFHVLKRAQALGDFAALSARNRRILRLHLENSDEAVLHGAREIVRKSLLAPTVR